MPTAEQVAQIVKEYSNLRQHSKTSQRYGYEIKENEMGIIVKGYVATTHPDSGFYDENREVYVKDVIAKETLEAWAKEINDGNPRANKVSVNHQRQPHVAGVGIKGTARVDKLEDGHYGLYVETLIDKTRQDFNEIKYRVDNGLLDSFSIEFTTKDPANGDYLPGAVREKKLSDECISRTLLPSTQLEGWTLASQPMNEYAVMIKEIFNKKFTEEKVKMEEEKKKEAEEAPEDDEEKCSEKPVAKKGAKPAKMNQTDGIASAGGKEIDTEALILGRQILEQKEKEKMAKQVAELKESMRAEIFESLKGTEVKSKVAPENPEAPMEKKEIMEYKEALKNPKMDIKEQFKLAAKLCESKGMITAWGVKPTSRDSMALKHFSTNGSRLEFKGLGLTTNQNSDTDYLLSAAELSDSFDPVIYNALNQQTVTWNILNKDDFSNKGNNLVQFTLKTAANTTAGAYTGNAINTGNVTRLKFETRFKKYQAGVAVDGDMIAAARGGPIGDVFAQEVMDSTIDLLSVMNQALFASAKGAETDAEVISFNYLTDSATNTTLYNLTRSTTNKLNPASAGDTYINQASARISLTNLRAAYVQALKDGSMIQNLVFVTNHTQGALFRGIYDAAQRPVPTSSRFGFEGRPEFDGIPIFEDKDCSTSKWFLIDLDSMRVAIWVPPTLEMLGKDSDSQKGFIKTYWATYCRAPRRIVEIYSCATS